LRDLFGALTDMSEWNVAYVVTFLWVFLLLQMTIWALCKCRLFESPVQNHIFLFGVVNIVFLSVRVHLFAHLIVPFFLLFVLLVHKPVKWCEIWPVVPFCFTVTSALISVSLFLLSVLLTLVGLVLFKTHTPRGGIFAGAVISFFFVFQTFLNRSFSERINVFATVEMTWLEFCLAIFSSCLMLLVVAVSCRATSVGRRFWILIYLAVLMSFGLRYG